MSRFQSHFKRALMFCVLAPAFAQYPCLAQSSNETAGPLVGAENLQITPPAINNFVETSSTAAEPFAAANLPWLNDIFATQQSPINPTKFALDGASAAPSSSSLGNSYPQSSAQSANGQTSGINKNYVLRGNFFQRLVQFYQQDWAGTNPSTPLPPKRGLPAPLDSPPFPSSDWIYGGAPDIGTPDGNTYPLMSALNLENGRTKIYGWVATSINFSTSGHNNFPVSYDVFPNKVEVNQAVLYVERLPDTVQNDHFDWGYHFTAFEGIDYRFTTAKGYFSQQLLKFNRQYGFDPVLEYLDLYFPVKDGLNIRIGRFLSVPGIEAQLAPNNYNMTHSLLYSIDPFTDTGIYATLKLTKQWIVQAGVSAGHDVAPWTVDRKASLIACLDYSTKSNNDNFYACANGINNGTYAYNNLQDYDGTWYHKFNARWHMATEAWYMYEREVPNVAGNVANPVPTETGANGAFCAPGELTCTAPEYAVVNYVNREVNPKLFIGFRSDLLDDK